nr:PREDICTED: uncharacterized protein LOC109038165 isoform X2 [Bemisia tabaci]
MILVVFLPIFYASDVVCESHGSWRPFIPPKNIKEVNIPSNFEDALKSSAFVDKTGFIREFFASKEPLYISAPHGFGKSTTIDMLRKFSEAKVDVNGTLIDRNSTRDYNMFLDKRLEVTRDSSFFSKHFCQYPVLELRFKYLMASRSLGEFERFFRAVVVVASKEHSYLTRSSKLTQEERQRYSIIYNNTLKSAPEAMAKEMTALLHAHHKKKCIVLIDDFDSSLVQVLASHRIFISDVQAIFEMLQKFLTVVVKKNDHLEKALVTGCVHLVSETAEDPKDVGIRNVVFGQDEKIAQYFGYTNDEVMHLCRKTKKDRQLDVLRAWYGGYAVRTSSMKLFNMISISKFFKTGNIASYWEGGNATKGLDFIFDYKIIGDEVRRALSYGTLLRIKVGHPFSRIFSVKAIVGLVEKARAFYEGKDVDSLMSQRELLLKYLTDHGYFSAWYDVARNKEVFSATIPNYEVRGLLDGFIYTPLFFESKYNLTEVTIGAFIQSLFNLTQDKSGYKDLAMAMSKLITDDPTIEGAAEWIRMLAVFADYSQKFEYIGREMLPNKEEGQNLIIITKEPELPNGKGPRTGILIRVMTDKKKLAQVALEDILKHGHQRVFEEKLKMLPIGNKILIGMHLAKNKLVTLRYLDGSTNIKKARDATSAEQSPKRHFWQKLFGKKTDSPQES